MEPSILILVAVGVLGSFLLQLASVRIARKRHHEWRNREREWRNREAQLRAAVRRLAKRQTASEKRLERVLRSQQAFAESEGQWFRRRFRQLRDGQNELALLPGIFGLNFRHPFFLTGWTIDGFMAHRLLEILESQRPGAILELGSGTSSVLIQAMLQKLGRTDVRHIAIDHDESYLEETKRRLELQGFAGRVECWFCPLSVREEGGPAWYDGIVERLAGQKLDLVVVDGPPGDIHPESRRPALPELRPWLNPGAIVLLDDAEREEEKATVDNWRELFPEMTVRLSKKGKGLAEFTLEPARVSEGGQASRKVGV